MHSRPTASDLIAAVAQHLSANLLPALSDPSLRYQTLVALHVLGIVERELRAGEDAAREEWAALQQLLECDEVEPPNAETLIMALHTLNGELAAQIRNGERDDDPELHTLLQAQVAAKLDVSNPKFRR